MILEVISTLALGVVVAVIIDYVIILSKLKQYPPGPIPLPLIGNLHLLHNQPMKAFKHLAKDYGSVMSFSFGRERIVIIQDIDGAREALLTNGVQFAGRPQENFATGIVTKGFQDIIFADYGPRLNAMRKIAHGALKMYGEGLSKLGDSVSVEIEKLFERFDEKNGQEFDPAADLGLSVTNLIGAILFGKRYKLDDGEFKEVLHFSYLIGKFDLTAAVNFISWLRYFPNKPLSDLKRGVLKRDHFLDAKLQEHRETFDVNNPRDFTDLVLYMQDLERTEGSSTGNVNDVNLEQIMSDLFLAGVETTTTTLRWSLLYLAAWPEIQMRIAEERKEKLGTRRPCLKDRGNLPYFEAVVHEIMRMSSVAPLGVPHKTMSDTICKGQEIPAGTQIWFNIWAMHNDENQWKEPDTFRPERFLDETGNLIIGAKKSYLPFGTGRRVCLGEALAKMELFMFLSSILYRYVVIKGEGESSDLEGIVGVINMPKPFKVKLALRS